MPSSKRIEGGITVRHRKKLLTVGIVVLLAAGLAAGIVFAQEGDEPAATTETTTESAPEGLMAKVAAILGIEEETLLDAFEQARLQEIDEAVAAGLLTEEQAAEMKAHIEARSAMKDVIDEAIASGELTEEQVELLGGRMRGMVASRLAGKQVEMTTGRLGTCGGGVGITIRTPRGMFRGGIFGPGE